MASLANIFIWQLNDGITFLLLAAILPFLAQAVFFLTIELVWYLGFPILNQLFYRGVFACWKPFIYLN